MAELSLEEGQAVLQRRANAARIVIYLVIAGEIARCIAGVVGLVMGATTDANSPLQMVYGVSAILFLISAVFVSMWIYRAHANLRDANVEGTTITPGWSVVWFFVPIAGLFKPFEAMRELWNASDGTDSKLAPDQMKIWWGAFIVGSIIDKIYDRIGGAVDGGFASLLILLGGVAFATSGYYLLGIIAHITRAQRSTLGMAQIFA